MRLRFDPERPIYQQIIDEFKRAIARGELAPGDRIPSQRELATEARINPNTVQRAYREMEWLGLTETLRGQGTFVVEDAGALHSLRQDMAQKALQRFVDEMSALGFEAGAIVQMAEQAVAGSPTGEGGPPTVVGGSSKAKSGLTAGDGADSPGAGPSSAGVGPATGDGSDSADDGTDNADRDERGRGGLRSR